MRFLLRLVVLIALIGAIYLTYRYTIKTPFGLAVYVAGFFSAQFFYQNIWDPVFGNSTIIQWLLSPFKQKPKSKIYIDEDWDI